MAVLRRCTGQVGRRRRPSPEDWSNWNPRDPGLLAALDGLIEPETRGDPQTPLRWTTRSTRRLARELTAMGHPVSHSVVAQLLRAEGYRLQGTRKTLEGAQHPDRDAPFGYINALAGQYLTAGEPVISVDTKKKELVGRFAQAGREWQPSGEPEAVSTDDFPSSADGKAIPYGVYDLADDSAWVSVGVDHDTSVFAVATITEWWTRMGAAKYPSATRLLITAGGGGSNGHRPWLWKHELATLAAATGLEITSCHYPPGTSKWNKIEAPVVLPHHLKLARPAAHHISDNRQSHRQHHDQHRTHCRLCPRPQPLPHENQAHRRAEELDTHHPTRLPPGLELHHSLTMRQVVPLYLQGSLLPAARVPTIVEELLVSYQAIRCSLCNGGVGASPSSRRDDHGWRSVR
jgi:hypothetical protein